MYVWSMYSIGYMFCMYVSHLSYVQLITCLRENLMIGVEGSWLNKRDKEREREERHGVNLNTLKMYLLET